MKYTDVNKNRFTKAYSVLSYFRSQEDFDNPLFEEFSSVVRRNAVGKHKSHETYKHVYAKLVDAAVSLNTKVNLQPTCPNSGMVVDMTIDRSNSKDCGVLFLLKEDLCQEYGQDSYEPLGVQKLMLKLLRSKSPYNLVEIHEPDVLASSDLEDLIKEKLEI